MIVTQNWRISPAVRRLPFTCSSSPWSSPTASVGHCGVGPAKVQVHDAVGGRFLESRRGLFAGADAGFFDRAADRCGLDVARRARIPRAVSAEVAIVALVCGVLR